jgi:catechol 2,3-dioxygenase-like lactoylglutathione lyase family enzyme
MAYRFLLHVPETYADEANAAVAAVGDAQVLVTRNSHGQGFDDPFVDHSVAAHTLAVIPAIYDWADTIGATLPESRNTVQIVLHDGSSIGVHEVDAPGMVAAIRRDQPWVERSMPKIGDHEPNELSSARRAAVRARRQESGTALAPDDTARLPVVQSVVIERSGETFSWQHEAYPLVQAMNLAAAEQFYADVLGLEIVGRLKRNALGNWESMPNTHDRPQVSHDPLEADRVLLRHGVLQFALARAGHGARLPYNTITTHFSLLLEPDVLDRLRATVLLRGYDVLEDDGRDMTFRDPFGVAWSVTDSAARIDR